MSDDYQPDPIYQQMLLEYLMGMGGLNVPGVSTQPSLYPAQMDSITGAVPGQLNPTQQANYLQDVVQMQVDPAIAAMYGAGAYSPDAFAPQETYTPVAQPGMQQLQHYVQNTPGSIEAFIAEQILSGASSSQAIAELRSAYDANPEDPEVMALVNQLPLWRDEMGEYSPDWGGAQDNARAMEQQFLSDPQPGAQQQIIDPQTGEVIGGGGEIVQGMDAQGNPVMMQVESQDSPMAEWYRERGLSLPTDQYTAEDLLGQQWQAGAQEFDQVYGDYQQQYQQWLAEQGQAEQTQQSGDQRVAERDAANLFGGGFAMGGGVPNEQGQQQQQRVGESGETYNNSGQVVYDPLSSANPGSRAVAQNQRQATQADYYDPLPGGQPSQASLDASAPDPFVQYMQEADAENAANGYVIPEQGNTTADWMTAAMEQILSGGGAPADYDSPGSMGPPTGPPPAPTPTSAPQSEQGSRGSLPDPQDIVSYIVANSAMGQRGRPQGRRRGENGPPTSPPQSEQGSRGRMTPTSAPQSEQGGNRGAGREAQNAQLRFLMGQATEAGAGIDRGRRTQQRGTYDRDFDYGSWDNMIGSRDRAYGADYGRAAAQAFLLQQQGVTPLQQQLAARRQVPIGMGLVGSGYLPGVG